MTIRMIMEIMIINIININIIHVSCTLLIINFIILLRFSIIIIHESNRHKRDRLLWQNNAKRKQKSRKLRDPIT